MSKIGELQKKLISSDLSYTSGTFLSFFPYIDTPVSIAQLQEMRAVYFKIRQHGYNIMAITINSIPERIQQMRFPFPIVQDPNGELAEMFGILKTGLNGKICLRRTFLITSDGKVLPTINDLEQAAFLQIGQGHSTASNFTTE